MDLHKELKKIASKFEWNEDVLISELTPHLDKFIRLERAANAKYYANILKPVIKQINLDLNAVETSDTENSDGVN